MEDYFVALVIQQFYLSLHQVLHQLPELPNELPYYVAVAEKHCKY